MATLSRWLLGAAVALLVLLAAPALAVSLAMNSLMDPSRWLNTLLLAGQVGLLGFAVIRLFRGGPALPWYAGGAALAIITQLIHSNGAVVGLGGALEALPIELLIIAFHAALGGLIWLTERRKSPPSVALRDEGV